MRWYLLDQFAEVIHRCSEILVLLDRGRVLVSTPWCACLLGRVHELILEIKW